MFSICQFDPSKCNGDYLVFREITYKKVFPLFNYIKLYQQMTTSRNSANSLVHPHKQPEMLNMAVGNVRTRRRAIAGARVQQPSSPSTCIIISTEGLT